MKPIGAKITDANVKVNTLPERLKSGFRLRVFLLMA